MKKMNRKDLENNKKIKTKLKKPLMKNFLPIRKPR